MLNNPADVSNDDYDNLSGSDENDDSGDDKDDKDNHQDNRARNLHTWSDCEHHVKQLCWIVAHSKIQNK